MKVLPFLFLVSGCVVEAQGQSAKVAAGTYGMGCETVGDLSVGDIERCENAEVVCYVATYRSVSISCFPKAK